ncbi:hypothetical protein EMIHUDRAFT_212793 [Emiliania huxleyi CCMP1516]|uniref:Uncharacterized protein n=2 Tax=Emiliania huxleyi TaxID=2903 RepID=A0A0D3IPA0_EMIH1|nr:hypothetical protein EMIHUDRAFT_212793 [Emiliania huxleyi CCMP1516]EOD13085.1 hypothetical protein EMIHUDRAFT_212793 [Emiliania huxleyi CCMP1516]|eukprot:XP_005765514.1 hypothetical protein EMIHUDRAFT_212793 [Emiliania huxleyi CCMP1516]
MRRVLLSVLLLQDGASAFTQPPIAHNRAKPPVAARSHGASAFTHPRPLIAHHAKALGAARSQGPAASAPQQQATTAAAVLGLCSQPIMWWSLYTLKTTGCGLPAGPFGLLGAAEGISYLVVIGFVAAALLSKATSGSGLPAGPGGLLGAAEGLSFLTAIAGLVVLGFQFQDYGYLPEAVPVQGGICTRQLS